jgi:HD-GYP domain-containing protein (c-di-GMP phosphodiesterase class II)
MSYSSSEISEIYWGGLLHDIGKLFVGELFVALDAQELPSPVTLPFIRAHACLGRSFLESVLPLFPTALTCAAFHQESVDGSGYPQGLTYYQLPVESQIVNLADGYDATVTRMGWSAAQVCADAEQMYARAGHPQAPVLSALIDVIHEHHLEWYPAVS